MANNTHAAVSIAKQPEVISPLLLGAQKPMDEPDLETGRSSKKHLLKKFSSKRLSGRPSVNSPALRANGGLNTSSEANEEKESASGHESSHHHHVEDFIDQVSEWIKHERRKHAEKKVKRHAGGTGETDSHGWNTENEDEADPSSKRRVSNASEKAFDLDKLESIIKQNVSLHRRSSTTSQRRKGSLKKLHRKQSHASSDTDYFESEILVPSCNVVLDNSKTLAYTGGVSDESDSSSDELEQTASYTDQNAWAKFKFEIVRLTHTLRLRGWRKVPMEMSNAITVKRLSGALTNCVYVVSPPGEMPHRREHESSSGANDKAIAPRKPPPKLLLRIYGSQVDHLIDREAELAILRRLARKKIGPRLLGTFANGRFEEYFYAQPLTAEEFHNPETSKQIAKRMRELHNGIELLDQERDDGPFVWRNWDKWVQRVEQVVTWLDCQITHLEPDVKPTGREAWKRRGFICGVSWKRFRQMVEKYRAWLDAQYGGPKPIREQLVFAHNDTQAGNILRMMPTGESPLLLPANTHKQLIVIDFEYASANVPGLEFANHFTEWCYDYHDPKRPYAFHPNQYPTPEEQDRFIRAYVRHRPQFNVSTPNTAPTETPPASGNRPEQPPSRQSTSSISQFMLDARAPSSTSLPQVNEEAVQNKREDQAVAQLIHETRIWRLANTAQWVAWGLVQAEVPGMPDFSPSSKAEPGSDSGEDLASQYLGERAQEYKDLTGEQQEGCESVNGAGQGELDEEFDYLGYAQHRALFFWADAIQLGLVKAEELPEELRAKVKKVPY